jgi:hypothetical protein
VQHYHQHVAQGRNFGEVDDDVETVTVVTQLCYSAITEVLQWCYICLTARYHQNVAEDGNFGEVDDDVKTVGDGEDGEDPTVIITCNGVTVLLQ